MSASDRCACSGNGHRVHSKRGQRAHRICVRNWPRGYGRDLLGFVHTAGGRLERELSSFS